MPTTKLIGLSGALRSDSTNSMLLREAARLYGEADFTTADLNLPLYNGDDEAESGVPAKVHALAQLIGDADGVIIATPEYNSGISGVLKNALDWISRTDVRPLANKPVAIMSAAAGRAGGVRAQTMLRDCLTSFGPRLITAPEIAIASNYEAFDENGRLTSERYISSLTALMDVLRTEINHD